MANLVEIKACEKFYRRHVVDIPRGFYDLHRKFLQRLYQVMAYLCATVFH